MSNEWEGLLGAEGAHVDPRHEEGATRTQPRPPLAWRLPLTTLIAGGKSW